MDLDDAELQTQLRETLQRAAEPVHGEGVLREAIDSEVARRRDATRRARWGGRFALAAAVAAAAAVSVFFLTRPEQDRVDTDGTVATQPSVPPTTGAPPDRTTVPTTPTSTPTTTTAASEATLPEFPPEDPLQHGKSTWGVYLHIVPVDVGVEETPEFRAAQQAAIDAGYSQGYWSTVIGCDVGAAEALGVEPDTTSPVVYFATEEQANQAKAAFEARGQHVEGIAHVTTYCSD